MDVSKLYVRQEIKNYKELCKLIGEKIKGGTAKKAQMKRLSQFVDFDKKGQKIIINEIYNKPQKRDDRRLSNVTDLYETDIELQLMYILSKKPCYECTFTARQLYQSLGMVNSKYIKPAIKTELINDETNSYTNFDINHFYQRTNTGLQKILFRVLRDLKDRFLLSTAEEQTIIVSEYKDEYGHMKEYYQVADKTQKRRITSAKHQALKEMKLETYRQVIFKFKTEEFNRIVDRVIREKYEWKRFFTQYHLVYNPKNIQEDIPLLIFKRQKIDLNNKILNATNQEAVDNYNKNIQDVERKKQAYLEIRKNSEWGIPVTGIKPFKYHEDYITIQQKLANELIKLEA